MSDNSNRFSKDFKAAKASKSKPAEKGTVIYDPRGQWDHPGQITKIPGNNITMQGVSYPVLGIDNFGNKQMMMPEMNYTFPNADNVTEYPVMAKGGMYTGQGTPHKTTSQNIQTSINPLMTRNTMLFGPGRKRLFQPMKTGGWLDKYDEMSYGGFTGEGAMQKFQGGGGTIHIQDNRKIRATTNQPINPNRDLKSGQYNNDYQIDSIAENATRRGVNPYQAISQGLVETGLGKSDWNIGHNLEFSSPENRYSEFMDSILESQKKAKRLGKTSDEDIIQAYNGYGKLTPKTENDYYHKNLSSFYGVPIPKEGLDMNKNPLYGKEVLDIQHNVIEPNKQINNIVKKYQYPRVPNPQRINGYGPQVFEVGALGNNQYEQKKKGGQSKGWLDKYN